MAASFALKNTIQISKDSQELVHFVFVQLVLLESVLLLLLLLFCDEQF